MIKEKLEAILSTENIEQNAKTAFEAAASYLMNNCLLQIGKDQYRLIELEFYYWSKNHSDCYIHHHEKGGHEQQKKFGMWYVHPSGMDLTFGKDGNAGGILLRGIRKIGGDKEILSGPINLRQPIIGSAKNVMANFKHLSHLDAFNNEMLSIVENKEPYNDDSIQCTRVGLKEKKEDQKAAMFQKEYRFIAEYRHDPERIHKFRDKEKVAKHILKDKEKAKKKHKLSMLKDILGYEPKS